jgi:hypothetical protein
MDATIGVETVDREGGLAWGTRVSLGSLLFTITILLHVDAALAYRPFDGTDAAVADPGEMEVELQPAGERASMGKKPLSRQRRFSTMDLPRTGRRFLRAGWKRHFLLRGPRLLATAEPS